MKRILYSFVCLLVASLAVSCQGNEEMAGLDVKTPFSIVVNTRTSVDVEPLIQSVRLFIFENGVCRINKLYGSSDLAVSRSSEDPNSYDIEMSDEFTLPLGTTCDIYAVINEAGYMSTMGDGSSFSDILGSVSQGMMNYGAFLDILDAKLAYDPYEAEISSRQEQPFVMLSYAKDVRITPSTPGECILVRMTEESRRSLALLRLARITSEPEEGETATDLDLLSKIFVKDIRLVNVPDGYFLTQDGGAGSSATEDIQIGSAGTDGFYERIWPGSVYENVSGRFTKKETSDARIYRKTKNNGNGCWGIVDASQAQVFTNMYDGLRYTANNGNQLQFIRTELNAYFQRFPGSVSDEPVLDNLTRSGLILSKDAWNIPLDHMLYIPEHLSQTSSQSTGLMVRLALSDPELDMSGLPMSYWNTLIDHWESSNDYFVINPTTHEVHQMTDAENSSSFYGTYAMSCWASDPTIVEQVSPDSKYLFFVGDIFRQSYAQIASTPIYPKDASHPDSPVVLKWNVPESGSNVIDVFVPINDLDLDDDYSIRRNVRYDVTLHVKKSTYDKFSTRTTNDNPIPVTVTATVNKVPVNQ